MRRLRLFAGILLLAAVQIAMPASASAQSVQRIAAIVNDEVISAYDLETRMQLVLFSTRLPNTPDVRKRLRSQVLRTLIDEKLQIQEAKLRNVSVSQRDIRRAMSNVEKQNGIPEGQLEAFLAQNNVSKEAMLAQMRANIAWSKLLGRRLRPRITIGEDEIDEVLDRIKTRQGQTEYRLAEIVLSVNSPDEENQVRSTAQRIVDQISKGARFSAIARQFSESATAAIGGDLGWIHEAELDSDLSRIVPELQRGSLSEPIKTISGYRIVLLIDSRKIAHQTGEPEKVSLQQIFMPVNPDADKTAMDSQVDLARAVADTASNCDDFSRLAKEVRSPRPSGLGTFEVNKLAPLIRNAVDKLDKGQISKPVTLPDGVLVLMVCDRTGGGGTIELPERDTVADQLLRDRLSLMARRYLRDIRLSAVVDIRV